MKKMGLLIALATVLTVGGVYATWQFFETDVVAHSNTNTGIGITTVEGAVAAGEITSGGSISLQVDQVTGTYNGVLQKASENSITFTFTPVTTATAEWKDGVKFSWTIAITNQGEFEDKKILLLTGTNESYTETDATDNTCTVTAADVLKAVKFNEAIEVNNTTEHSTLKTALSACEITITASVVAG